MFIDSSWRVLTVGDGDLSFSYALHKCYPELDLHASILDSFDTLRRKYDNHFLDKLLGCGMPVHAEVDVTKPGSFEAFQANAFDLIIFQFPLLPGFKSQADYRNEVGAYSINTLNRRLVRQFLQHAFGFLLDDRGQRLCYVTSKDVKPYSDWNIENIAAGLDGVNFIGQHAFNISSFPEYQIRNVDKDNYVKDTQGTTYAWSTQPQTGLKEYFSASPKHLSLHCTLCGDGPFVGEKDQQQHEKSKSHQRRELYEAQWLEYLSGN